MLAVLGALGALGALAAVGALGALVATCGMTLLIMFGAPVVLESCTRFTSAEKYTFPAAADAAPAGIFDRYAFRAAVTPSCLACNHLVMEANASGVAGLVGSYPPVAGVKHAVCVMQCES